MVDTGIHAKRWTRATGDRLPEVKNTPNAEADCIDSINRYIVMPSQATAYKIGMLKILELREKAKKQLGEKFDLRQFHEVVLTTARCRSICWRNWSIAGSSRNRLASVKGMDRDTEQLNLLAIFHYIVAGLAALFSFFPLLYTAVGVIFIFVARHGTAKPGEELPPEFLGWIFAVMGSVLFLIGIAMAICILIAGRSLALRNRYSFAFVIACIECLFVPFGTILGVFTIIVLSRESVKALFAATQTSV